MLNWFNRHNEDERMSDQEVARINAGELTAALNKAMRTAGLFSRGGMIPNQSPNYYLSRGRIAARWYSPAGEGRRLGDEGAEILARCLIEAARNALKEHARNGAATIEPAATPVDDSTADGAPCEFVRLSTEFGPAYYWTWGNFDTLQCGHGVVVHTMDITKDMGVLEARMEPR